MTFEPCPRRVALHFNNRPFCRLIAGHAGPCSAGDDWNSQGEEQRLLWDREADLEDEMRHAA